MQSLEPLINLLVLLTVLGVAAERATNLRKLSQPATRTRATDPDAERTREANIARQSAFMVAVLRLQVKADPFGVLSVRRCAQ